MMFSAFRNLWSSASARIFPAMSTVCICFWVA